MKPSFYLIICLIFCSCAGTIRTVNYSNYSITGFKKACVISSENSQFIKFKFGIITPVGYFIPADDPAVKKDAIGNTDVVIKQELEKYGIQTEIIKRSDQEVVRDNFDLIVVYNDTWRWDFVKILDNLEIVFITPKGDSVIAQSTYNICQNKEFHNFPTPRKEVPKMIKELFKNSR